MFTEDLDAFLNTDTGFAQSVTVNGQSVKAIYNNSYAAGNVGMLGMASTTPALELKTSDVPSNPLGMAVVVNAINYLVAAHEPDGTGMSVLMLEAA
jgi:hypothetical protein